MNNERGMTLVELLATIAIFSMIVGVLFSLFSFAQASWTQTEGTARTENEVQELKTILTRELASPINLTLSNNELRFETQEETFNILKVEDKQLSLYQNEESFSTSSLSQQFTLPVKELKLLDQNKNSVPSGTELTEGYGFLQIYYTEEGLNPNESQFMIPVNLFHP